MDTIYFKTSKTKGMLSAIAMTASLVFMIWANYGMYISPKITDSERVWLQALFLLVDALIVYGICMIIIQYGLFTPKHKPAITYDEEYYSFYDSTILGFRKFKWEDIHHFELTHWKGNTFIQIHLQNHKLVKFYRLQTLLGGLSINANHLDANTNALMKELNQRALSR